MTTKTDLLKIIRQQCITCCGGSYTEVEACQGGQRINEFTTCYLWPFRFGTDPFNEVSEAKRAQGQRLAALKKERSDKSSNVSQD